MIAKELDQYYPTLLECFSADPELVSQWHIVSGTSAEDCAKRTDADLRACHESFKFVRLEKDNTLFGYFGAERIDNRNHLTGFFIMPQHRSPEGYVAFWNMVDVHFSKKLYMAAVYSKNIRACKFLNKNNGTLIAEASHEGNPFQVFGFNLTGVE